MVSHFWRAKKKKREERKKKKRREEEEEEGEEKRYGSLGFFMEKLWILVWNVWNLCMALWMGVYVFVWENQTINPFLINFGLKEPYLVYWWCFGFRLVDCNPQVRNICIKEILGF